MPVSSHRGLLRNSFQFVAPDKDQLRAIDVVSFKGRAIPGWAARPCGERRTRRVVRRTAIRSGLPHARGAAVSVGRHCIAVSLPEPGIIRPMLGLALGSLIFKPQLGLAAAVIFVITLRWRVIAGALLASGAQMAAQRVTGADGGADVGLSE